MEKFSAYRDLGTGIQPFLTPLPPAGSTILANAILPLRLIIGTVRTILVLVLLGVWIAFVPGFCSILAPVSVIRCSIEDLLTSIICRSILFILGFFWISPEKVSLKGGRRTGIQDPWSPHRGDVIVTNWASWIEILWLAYRLSPTFVVPIPATGLASFGSSESIKNTANTQHNRRISLPSKKDTSQRVPIAGFRQVSLLRMISLTGSVPSISHNPGKVSSLDDIRKATNRPVLVFPECTTSNGRGLLRFADVFQQKIPVQQYCIYVMCIRYDPPSTLSPTLTLSIPSMMLNPLSHIFSVASTLTIPTISVRLLPTSESPSSPLFLASEVLGAQNGTDELSECCATLISRLGRIKRTNMGWEDKASFFEFYRSKRKHV